MSDLLKAAQQASKAPLVSRQNRTTTPAPRFSNQPERQETWGSRHTRKTLHLRTDLIEQARGEAVKQGISLSAYVNQALEEALRKL